MQTRRLFPLWPRLHQDVLRFLDLTPPGALATPLPGGLGELGSHFRHLGAVEQYWRQVILGPASSGSELGPASSGSELGPASSGSELSPASSDAGPPPLEPLGCPDGLLAARLGEVFAATERLLDASLAEALLERPVRSPYPVRNALEALSLCHVHTVHHRAHLALGLSALGIDPGDWI